MWKKIYLKTSTVDFDTIRLRVYDCIGHNHMKTIYARNERTINFFKKVFMGNIQSYHQQKGPRHFR